MGRDRVESASIDWFGPIMKIWLNDCLVDQLVLPPTGGGWLLGDGIFESLRTYNGTPFALDLHSERLMRSAE